jgi:hypothetical protein
MELKRLPIGIQSFCKLREGNYLYVDKHNIRELYCARDTGRNGCGALEMLLKLRNVSIR